MNQLEGDKYEVYVIAGVWGKGGTGDKGFTETLAEGKLTVPAALWKVIVILPTGSKDATRVNDNTRTIAVWMENRNTIKSQPWSTYRTSIREIERRTGLDFLSNVPQAIRDIIETRTDARAIQSVYLFPSF